MNDIIIRTNLIARGLFNACAAATDEQLIGIETLEQLGELFDANLESECARIYAQHGRDAWWMCPSATWTSALDEDKGPALVHTTGTGRLTVTARQGQGYREPEIEFALDSPSGRIARLVWRGDETIVMEINHGLIAEKPSRVELIDDLHRRAGLPYPPEWERAIDRTRAMREAADALMAASTTALARIPVYVDPEIDPLEAQARAGGGLVFTPDDFAPVG